MKKGRKNEGRKGGEVKEGSEQGREGGGASSYDVCQTGDDLTEG